MTILVVDRADVSERRMPAHSIVEDFDVLEDLPLGRGPLGEYRLVNRFHFPRGEKALRNGIVPAVAFWLMLQAIPLAASVRR